nr:uncharacterized protein LOC109146561 [Ipomoea batatas]
MAGGGDHGGDFREKVWTMAGGPNCRPRYWKRNTAIAMAGIVLICIPIAMKSAELEVLHIFDDLCCIKKTVLDSICRLLACLPYTVWKLVFINSTARLLACIRNWSLLPLSGSSISVELIDTIKSFQELANSFSSMVPTSGRSGDGTLSTAS